MKLSVKIIAGAIAIIVITIFSITGIASPKQSGIKRTDLQRHDLSAPGREMIQALVELAPGAAFGMHKHPGEEIIYVTEGALEYDVEGKGVVKLKAGDVLFVPAGTYHSARNNGQVSGAELATYVVEKGKPLIEFKK
ncbi:cupin domain-containing protein [Paraflavitalea sp. CAU 1676]|uniref:cupin domain-containing protein n=1 Tax=Paraflavitalea sp. CAU 1676 TaxID=3032598 RepID=UPI0023DB74AF|nr:cupin domain-containing protein [Paraflavitalea sp. CAU 1676]MDF2188513.1 cupin domain-containing protein [Paraflavitalea sp. CAU 1676]